MNDNQMLPAPQGQPAQTQDNVVPQSVNAGGVSQQSSLSSSQLQQQASGYDASALPATAGDIDLIEKEWVTKAKAIVASTIGDPKRQSTELSNAKAQYIAKRFNKELPKND